MNRIMMVGSEWGKPSEMRNFHSEYYRCENMCMKEQEERGHCQIHTQGLFDAKGRYKVSSF
jgi:hypothetical protein